MKNYTPPTFGINEIEKESHDLRMKRNQQRRAFLRRRVEELKEELTRIKLEIKMNKLEGAEIHNEQVLIFRLPPEITAYIFEVARGQTRFDDSAEDGPWESIKKRPEIIISHVCRSWRSISLAHPPLWSHFLHIHDGDPGIPLLLSWMSAYLQRSKKKPLDIILDLTCVPEGHDDYPCDYADRILHKLIPHAARWRRLSMYVSHDGWDPYIGKAPLRTLSTPLLEVFEIAYLVHNGDSVMRDHSIFLGGAPNLVSVRMDSFRWKALKHLSTITTLHLYGSPDFSISDEPWDTFLLIMATPTLVNLTFESICFEEPWPIESAPRNIQRIVAPSLRNLRLHASFEVVSYIWNFIAAPKLQLLAISDSGQLNNSIPILQDLSSSSFVSLKTLILLNCNVEIAILSAFSQVTHGLIHLILDADRSIKRYIDHIVGLGPSSILWPSLEVVTCVAMGPSVKDFGSPSLTDCAKVMTWQAALSGKPCILQMDAKIANHWISQSQSKKELWDYLFETGIVEVAHEDGPYSSIVPWPHHGSGHFRVGKSEVGLDI